MFEAHFQTFEEPESGVALTARLSAFREELARRKLTGFVIPRADQQQNEYVAPSEERLAWLTGFTGSAGMATVLTQEAAVFVDGRYTLQASKQVDHKAWSVEPLADPPPENWLAKHLSAGDRLGFDPWLHTSAAAQRQSGARARRERTAGAAEPAALAPNLPGRAQSGASIALASAPAADALSRLIVAAGGKPVRGNDPVSLLKAVKNPTEIEGTRRAHRRDAVALTRFLAWIDREAQTGALTEIDAVEALETFRRDTGALKDVSFPTIAGAGPNGAIVHYRVTRKSNRPISPGDLLLIDSGAQYDDGTTDVTRTIAIGEPSAEMRDRFTRVLRGHIAIARAVFPDGTTGAQLDTLARQFLWQDRSEFGPPPS